MRVLRHASWLVVPLVVIACDRTPTATTPPADVSKQLSSATRLGQPLYGLTSAQYALFHLGQRVFDSIFTPQTGLGPVFNANGCATCHINGGAGTQVEIQGSVYNANGTCNTLDSIGGFVFELQSTPQLLAAIGVNGEPIPSFAQTGRRTTPQLFGRGLLGAIPDSAIKARAALEQRQDPRAAGRVAVLSDGTIGRFGRKNQGSTVLDFNTDAFLYEMGITTPTGDSLEKPVGTFTVPPSVEVAPEPNLSLAKLQQTTDFVSFLAPPPRPPDNDYQEETFERVGCATCHVPAMQTGANPVAALSHKTVHAYTDLLLHDMGPGLADICLGAAKPSEFRTEPLMGLGIRTAFLHDGRATTVTQAILAHDGQASAARQRFTQLPEEEREALVRYLRTF
jgi:CxxC motif-containing protein (DUF1111 family)